MPAWAQLRIAHKIHEVLYDLIWLFIIGGLPPPRNPGPAGETAEIFKSLTKYTPSLLLNKNFWDHFGPAARVRAAQRGPETSQCFAD